MSFTICHARQGSRLQSPSITFYRTLVQISPMPYNGHGAIGNSAYVKGDIDDLRRAAHARAPPKRENQRPGIRWFDGN